MQTERLLSSKLSIQRAENCRNLGPTRSHILAFQDHTANTGAAVTKCAGPVPPPLYESSTVSSYIVQHSCEFKIPSSRGNIDA